MLCPGDTLATLERAEGVIHEGRTRDARTVEAMGSLLVDHADVDTLIGAPEDDRSAGDDDGVGGDRA
jgi:BioD-like phosphotransacetylase family protein